MQEVTKHLTISWQYDNNLLFVTDKKQSYSCIVRFRSRAKLDDIVQLKELDEKEAWRTANWISARSFAYFPEFGIIFRTHFN